MDSGLEQTFIQRVAEENRSDLEGTKILWSRHALAELAVEGWNRRQVEGALLNSNVIEDYPTLHRPLSDCLVLAWVASTTPIHVVVAIDEEWEDGWKTRK